MSKDSITHRLNSFSGTLICPCRDFARLYFRGTVRFSTVKMEAFLAEIRVNDRWTSASSSNERLNRRTQWLWCQSIDLHNVISQWFSRLEPSWNELRGRHHRRCTVMTLIKYNSTGYVGRPLENVSANADLRYLLIPSDPTVAAPVLNCLPLPGMAPMFSVFYI